MNRRQFIANMGLGLAAMGASAKDTLAMKLFSNKALGIGVKSAKNDKFNLLIILCDELTFRALGCYRKILPSEQTMLWGPQAKIDTPNIDWIADNGAICKNCYATTPLCSPSRSSFVSGRYPQNTTVVTNDLKLSADTISFAKILLDRGYTTGYCGKWHLDGPPSPGWYPADNFGFSDNRYMWNRGHQKKIAFDDPTAQFLTGIGNATSFPTDFLTARTIEYINAHAAEQFCYMVAFPDPHSPDKVRVPYDTMYNNLSYQTPSTYNKVRPGIVVPNWAAADPTIDSNDPPVTIQNIYFGMIKCIDDNVGKILQTLRDQNLIDKTVIVFTADHGDLRCEYHREDKRVPMEGSAHIPFMIYYPGKIPAGRIVNEALSCVDFLPTILGLMNIPTAGKEDGRDASQLLLTGQAPAEWQDVVFMRGATQAVANPDPLDLWVAAVTMRYKLVLSEVDPPWLIDLQENSVDELAKNCFDDPNYASIRSDLAGKLLTYGNKYNDPRVKMTKIQNELNAVI